MKVKILLLAFVICTASLAGCKQAEQPTPTPQQQQPKETNPENKTTDTSSSASIVDNNDAFVQAISRGGTWIIATKQDLTIDKDLLVDGEFKNTKEPPVSMRKIALYAQDADRKVTARYTLTAPKMTISSPDCSIWYGTFKGDLYVSANNFQLKGATIDGNIYFTTDEAKATFKPDTESKITGKQELKK
jgi:hypothetical protein